MSTQSAIRSNTGQSTLAQIEHAVLLIDEEIERTSLACQELQSLFDADIGDCKRIVVSAGDAVLSADEAVAIAVDKYEKERIEAEEAAEEARVEAIAAADAERLAAQASPEDKEYLDEEAAEAEADADAATNTARDAEEDAKSALVDLRNARAMLADAEARLEDARRDEEQRRAVWDDENFELQSKLDGLRQDQEGLLLKQREASEQIEQARTNEQLHRLSQLTGEERSHESAVRETFDAIAIAQRQSPRVLDTLPATPVLLTGLPGGGKMNVLQHLQSRDSVLKPLIDALAFEPVWMACDCGEEDHLQHLWKQWMRRARAIVFVVQCNDDRLDEALTSLGIILAGQLHKRYDCPHVPTCINNQLAQSSNTYPSTEAMFVIILCTDDESLSQVSGTSLGQ